MYKVLNMNYYTLSEPETCLNVLKEYKEFNDPVRQFFDEFEDNFVWDLLPFPFLYELYKAWFRKNSPSGSIQGKNKFISEIVNVVKSSPKWDCSDKTKNFRSAGKMDQPEPLILTYDLQEWKNPNYTGGDIAKICSPHLLTFYRGLVRRGSSIIGQIDDDEGGDDE